MILQALMQLAENEKLIADPDFEFKPVSWIVRLKEDGSVLAIEDNRQNLNEGQVDRKGRPIKPKWIGMRALVPSQFVRTSGDAAYFAVDKSDYVFGTTAEKPKRLGLFWTQLNRCLAATDDPSIAAVVALGKRLTTMPVSERAALLPKDATPGDLIAFRVGTDSVLLHERSSVQAYWKALRTPTATKHATTESRRCLVSCKSVTEVPLFNKIKRMPGDSSGGLSLVSFNASAWESYGWKDKDNAPVSRDAAEAVVTALNRLLDPRPTDGTGEHLPVRRIRMAEDTAVVFWSPAREPDAQSVLDVLPDLFDPGDRTADVGNLFTAVRSGTMRELTRPAAFYAMTLTSVTGRIVVRDWLESTVSRVQSALRSHFDALECVRNTPPSKGIQPRAFLSLRELFDSLAAPGRAKQIPTVLATEFMNAAFANTPYPSAILQRALLRERAEVTADDWDSHIRRDARAALIKAVLIRDPRYKTKVEASMDESRFEPGYLLGRLMAVLEDMQRLASGGVNASIKDKFYGAASATPAAVFPTMMDMFHEHARKARDERAGAVVNREKLVDRILSKLNVIPVHLDLKEQGLFVLGYHHQRHALYTKPTSEPNEQQAGILEGASA